MRRLELAQGTKSPEEAFVDAILYSREQGFQSTPRILSFYPEANNNPFQQLLYREASQFSFVTLGFSNFKHLGRLNWGGDSWIHLHWLKKILQEATSAASAKKLLKDFTTRVKRLKDNGHRILWTVHNVFPHEMKFQEEEIELSSFLAEEASAVHVMTKDTKKRCSPYFNLEESKMFFTPHPLYEGIYPDFFSKEEARYQLSLSDERIFLIFGALDPYKKVHKFLDGLEKKSNSCSQKNLYLLVGGVSSQEYLNELENLASQVRARVKIIPKKISVEQVSFYFKACDAVIIPYEETLNSGVVALAASFEKLVLCKKFSGATAILGEDYPYFLESFEEKELIGKLKEAKNSSFLKDFFSKNLYAHSSKEVSKKFFSSVLRFS